MSKQKKKDDDYQAWLRIEEWIHGKRSYVDCPLGCDPLTHVSDYDRDCAGHARHKARRR